MDSDSNSNQSQEMFSGINYLYKKISFCIPMDISIYFTYLIVFNLL